MDDIKAKQQIVEKIQASTNILVTVSNDPSVDALSAALGLTLLLDKIDKHPTAIFSGNVPPAISFLEPEKTFDSTTDSLRDFIIALNKEKADHLRYKVEGDAVKIFITPYKTTITSDDLEFSQGDFNVELIIALGVDNQDHLDAALESHGQILHDAAIITVTAGEQVSTLGGIDWHDAQASSLSEMVAGLAEALKTDKTKSLLDAPVATAFLTGIVAETDRFSNPKTTARVMTTAAQLMAAGADQQLIAAKLESSHEISQPATAAAPDESAKENLSISHDNNETLEQLDKRVKSTNAEAESVPTPEVTSAYAVDADDATPAAPTVAEPTAPVMPAPQITNAYAPEVEAESAEPAFEPSLGGSLSATTEQAADDARKEAENDQNKTILSHSYISSTPSYSAPMNGAASGDPGNSGEGAEILGHELAAPGAGSVNELPEMPNGEATNSAYALDPAPTPTFEPTLMPEPTPAPMTPPAPADLGLPMPPALPDFSQLPSAPAAPAMPPLPYAAPPMPPQPELLGDILAPEPVAEPSAPTFMAPTPPPAPTAMAPPAANNPAQFKIPGQE